MKHAQNLMTAQSSLDLWLRLEALATGMGREEGRRSVSRRPRVCLLHVLGVPWLYRAAANAVGADQAGEETVTEEVPVG
jgi:hypothetical protein